MAKVPFQNYNLNQQVAIGGEVQFGATSVQPQKDVVSDDITKMGKAQQEFGKVLNKLDDEINDAESKQLFNNFYSDLDTIRRDYLDLEGALAVATVTPEGGGEPVRQYDIYNDKIKTLLESYQEKASNGVVKYMFENMAQVSVTSAQSSMTTHSLIQQRKYADNERTITIGNLANASIIDAESWQDPTSTHNTSRIAGLKLLEEQAIADGLIISGDNVSQEWIKRVREYNMKIHEGVVDYLTKTENWPQLTAYIAAHYDEGNLSKEDADVLIASVKERHTDYNSETIVNHILNNNNPTDFSIENQANLTLCLASNNNTDNNNDGMCINGFHTNEFDPTDFNDQEQLSILEQKRNESIFFQPDSTATISEVNQPTHLFAIQTIGVEKADKFYTKALKSVKIDKDRYETDKEYRREIDGQVLNKFNELFIEEVQDKFGLKTEELRNKIKYIEAGSGQLGVIPGSNTDLKIKELQEQIAIEEAKPDYAGQVIKDIKILQEGVRYVDVNGVTGLQPLSVYEELLEKTIEDPKQLAYAKEDLKIKYNQINNQKNEEYKQTFLKAQEIALAKEGGWKDLEANGIDINMFTEEDQERLKNGQPLESNKDTYIELIENPGELKNNLDMYRVELNEADYLKLKAYADSLRTDGDVTTVTTDSTMLKTELNRAGFSYLYASDRSEDEKTDYIQIEDAWRNAIAEEERITGKKVGRDRKRELLVKLLNDKVILDTTGDTWFPLGGADISVPVSLVDDDQFDQLYVKVNGQNIWLSEIPKYQEERIIEILLDEGKPVTQHEIARLWVKHGKPKASSKEEMAEFTEKFDQNNMQ